MHDRRLSESAASTPVPVAGHTSRQVHRQRGSDHRTHTSTAKCHRSADQDQGAARPAVARVDADRQCMPSAHRLKRKVRIPSSCAAAKEERPVAHPTERLLQTSVLITILN